MFGSLGDKLMDILDDIFTWLYESLIEPFLFLHSFGNLIYGEGRREELVHNTFTTAEITDIFHSGSALVSTIAGFIILMAIIVAGMRISSTAINPSNRTYYIEFLKDLGIVLIIFFNLGFFYDLVFTANSGIISVFAADQDEHGGLLTTLGGTGIIGTILVGIIMLFLMIWANWYYMMRKLTLLILMVLGPLMIALFLFPQFKGITGAWFKEFVGTVFVQSIHAILFWMITIITAGQETDVANAIFNLETVILYLIFIPVGESIRALLGMGGGMSTNMSKAGAMFGMSALAGVYGSVKGALDKNGNSSVMGALQGAKDGVRNSNKGSSSVDEESTIRDATLAANTGTNSGTSPKAESMLKWGDIGSRAGKAILGSAGSIGGAAIGGPMGSMIAATGGFAAGGVIGGATGRGSKALTDLATDNIKKGISDGKDTWNNMANPLDANREDMANKIADKNTADYENANKTEFLKNAQENFPDLDKKGLEMQWEEHKAGIHEGNLSKARDMVRKSTSSDGKLASANKLAENSANEMTSQWANENKEAFDEEYDNANPLPPNATESERAAHKKHKNNAWNQKVAAQKEMYQGVANKTANQMKDEAMGSEMISRKGFANSFAENMQAQDEQAFIEEYQRQNPNAPMEEATNAFKTAKGNNARSNFAKSYMDQNKGATLEQANQAYDMANNAKSKDDYVNKYMEQASNNHSSTANKSYDMAKAHIDSGNDKEGFIKNYQSNVNPSATREQAGQMYEAVKESGSKAEFLKGQAFTPSESMKKQAGNTYSLAKQQAELGDKESFVQSYQSSNPNSTRQQAEALYDKANTMSSGGARSYHQSANSALNNVKPESVFNKGANKQVNRGYFTNQLAAVKTQEDKANYINDQVASGVTPEQATTSWAGREKQQFNNNLSHFENQLPQSLPMKQAISRSSGIQKTKAALSAGTAFVGTASGVTPTIDAANNVGLKGYMVTKSFKDGYTDGTDSVLQSPENIGSSNSFVTRTKAIGSGISQGISTAGNAMQPFVENAVENQKKFQNAVAYTGGIIGGANLYQKAGNLASRVNPYNKAINNSVESGAYETSEIRQMASQVNEETGQSHIPQGNIKLVSTPTQSYVQATDSAGQKRIVSRYGSGDSALNTGQVVYQDLTVDDRGGLKPISQAYQMDTGGAKVETGRNINVNPNKLVATKRAPAINPMVTQDVSPYNASVETGSFSKNDAITNTKNIRMVVTKERSYMVGQDKSSGEAVRISPYKAGDARLDVNDVREVEYVVENKRFNVKGTTDNHGQKVDYEPRLDTDEYLYSPQNQRTYRRNQYEKQRFKGIGGAD